MVQLLQHFELIIFSAHLFSLQVAPNVTILNERSVHVLERSHVDIECSIEASPRTVSYWIKEPLGRSFQQYHENPRQNVLQESEKYNITESFHSYYKTTLRMRISNFSENDIGVYTCIASNMMGRANATIRLYGELNKHPFIYLFFLFSICDTPRVAHSMTCKLSLFVALKNVYFRAREFQI
jgi:hypothetical protein